MAHENCTWDVCEESTNEFQKGCAAHQAGHIFYVSMAADLLGVYILYRAQSRRAVNEYLEREYMRNGVWKLPWCAIYTEAPVEHLGLKVVIVEATCGTIHEEFRA